MINPTLKRFRNIFSTLLPVVAGVMMAACDAVYDDQEPCAPDPNTLTTVNFVYDYNMLHTDLFTDHAGSVYLYIFDNDGVYRHREEKHYVDMPKGHIDFSMTFDTTVLVPGHTYQMVAIAQGNRVGVEDSQETPGFTLLTEMIKGKSRIEDYVLKLDRDDDGNFDFGVVNYKDAYGHNEQMIDTIWTTKPDEVQTVTIPEADFKPSLYKQPDRQLYVDIPMMRITNSVTVNLVGPLFTETTNVDDYHVLINFPHGNGTIDFTGNTLPAQELYYQTLRKNMVPYTPKQATRADSDTYALQSVFGVSRLQIHDESSLQVRDAATNELIFQIDNFSDFLADAFNDGYSDGQEFLDREYDFEVDVALDSSGDPLWATITAQVLGWTVRINFVSF